MNHYCTYFDRGFLIQGLALWRSLAAHDRDAVLWVLALDDFTTEALREVGGTWLRVVPLAELEAGDAALAAAKANRTRLEYFFTLSPCWPRWLLAKRPEIDRVTYLDADLFFFGSPAPVFEEMDHANASVLVTEHRFPAALRHYEQHGKFNVGLLSFRNDDAGRACLDDWRARCLAWCHDRLEDGKYADQKYLDAWPALLGSALLVLAHAGVNFAPWNWARHRYAISDHGCEEVDGRPLVCFHFARFAPLGGGRWWRSGQLDYGVMPPRLRNALYGVYHRALLAACADIAARRAGFDFPKKSARSAREFWRSLPARALFGGDWLLLGGKFFNLRAGFGRWSGRALARARKLRT